MQPLGFTKFGILPICMQKSDVGQAFGAFGVNKMSKFGAACSQSEKIFSRIWPRWYGACNALDETLNYARGAIKPQKSDHPLF